MRIIVETKKVYTFKEASRDLKDLIKEVSFSDGWHFEHYFEERIASIEALSKHLGIKVDYSIGYFPSRGEFIRFQDSVDKKELKKLNKLDCPLTGVCYDHDLIDALLSNNIQSYIDSIHNEYNKTLEDSYLIDFCESNNYEFTINGSLY